MKTNGNNKKKILKNRQAGVGCHVVSLLDFNSVDVMNSATLVLDVA
jgi:hypothetical protein